MLSPGWVQSSPEFTPCKHHSRAFYQRQKLAKIQASDEEYSKEYS
ncbi:8408_t:CDS:2 [Rhizophagus irregularis]|nr:8408_t:CDS:2 [Rhizophagus irregularis]